MKTPLIKSKKRPQGRKPGVIITRAEPIDLTDEEASQSLLPFSPRPGIRKKLSFQQKRKINLEEDDSQLPDLEECSAEEEEEAIAAPEKKKKKVQQSPVSAGEKKQQHQKTTKPGWLPPGK